GDDECRGAEAGMGSLSACSIRRRGGSGEPARRLRGDRRPEDRRRHAAGRRVTIRLRRGGQPDAASRQAGEHRALRHRRGPPSACAAAGAGGMTTADRSISAYLASLRRMAAIIGGSAVEAAPGVLLIHTGVRLATFNGVFVRDSEPEWDAVAAAVREYVPTSPWFVTLRSRPDEAVERAASDAGLTSRMDLPLLV